MHYRKLLYCFVFVLSAILLTATLGVEIGNDPVPNFVTYPSTSIDPILVSSESDFHSHYPAMAIGPNNTVHVSWSDSSILDVPEFDVESESIDIFYKRNESGWTTTELVSDGSQNHSYNPDIAVDNSGNVHIVWMEEGDWLSSGADYDIYYRKYFVNTNVWSSVQLVSTESTSDSKYPSICTDSYGTAHVVWQDTTDIYAQGTDYDIFYKSRESRDINWQNPVYVLSYNHQNTSIEASLSCTSTDDLVVVWSDETNITNNGEDADIFYRIFEYDNSSWYNPKVLTLNNAISRQPQVVVDENSLMHVVWTDNQDFLGANYDYDIWYNQYNFSTQTWKTSELVSNSAYDSFKPSLAIDSLNNVHVSWYEGGLAYDDYGDKDVIYRLRDSKGDWSEGVEISIPEPSASPSQDDSIDPQICVDSINRIHIVWSDITGYENQDTDYDIIYRMSNPPYYERTITQTYTASETTTVTENRTETTTETAIITNTSSSVQTITKPTTITENSTKTEISQRTTILSNEPSTVTISEIQTTITSFVDITETKSELFFPPWYIVCSSFIALVWLRRARNAK